MERRVTYRKIKSKVNWEKIQDAAFSVFYWIIIALFIIAAAIGIWTVFGQKGNAIENSSQWAGYSEVGVHQIYDRKTGVMYAVTDAGNICVMVDENGDPMMVD